MVRVRLMPWESSPPPLAELCLLTLARHVDRLGDLGDLPDDLVETLLVGTCARLCAKVATEKRRESSERGRPAAKAEAAAAGVERQSCGVVCNESRHAHLQQQPNRAGAAAHRRHPLQR